METYTSVREFVKNDKYLKDRKKILTRLDYNMIDQPIRDVVKSINLLSYCFTLQCCYGHFLYSPPQDEHNMDRLPQKYGGQITWRIAYIACCIEDCTDGYAFRNSLEKITEIDPGYIQFGSADWFWKQHNNTYVLQVEPDRFKLKDQSIVGHAEALHIENVRDLFFNKLRDVVKTNKD